MTENGMDWAWFVMGIFIPFIVLKGISDDPPQDWLSALFQFVFYGLFTLMPFLAWKQLKEDWKLQKEHDSAWKEIGKVGWL